MLPICFFREQVFELGLLVGRQVERAQPVAVHAVDVAAHLLLVERGVLGMVPDDVAYVHHLRPVPGMVPLGLVGGRRPRGRLGQQGDLLVRLDLRRLQGADLGLQGRDARLGFLVSGLAQSVGPGNLNLLLAHKRAKRQASEEKNRREPGNCAPHGTNGSIG
jgi:hypothetical protein